MRQSIVWITVVGVILLVGIGMFFSMRVSRTAVESFPADKGLNYIDVSTYPEEMRSLYKLFTHKCSKCHTVARPINSSFQADEWQKYVLKMMKKPGSGLNPKTAEKIIKFLVYDAQHRKTSSL